MSGKKGMYHSELVKMSPVTALIMSEPTESKFPDRPRWIALEINGEERFLSCENVGIELALAGLKGQWARLNAKGRGEEAVIELEDAPQTSAKAALGAFAKAKAVMTPQPRQNEEDGLRPGAAYGPEGVLAARKHIMQAANLYNLCVACVDKVIAPEVPQIAQTSEMFRAAVGTLFIEASRVGFVAKMPDTAPLKLRSATRTEYFEAPPGAK